MTAVDLKHFTTHTSFIKPVFFFSIEDEEPNIPQVQLHQAAQDTNLFSKNGSYKGTPWKNDRTINVQTLAETKFARCDVHTVLSEDGKNTVNDWIFMEEMDAVNVVVLTAKQQFVVFKQRKYAIPGDTFSPVGGFVDQGESPWEGARREVMEELGLGSQKTLDQLSNLITEYTDNKAAFTGITKQQRTIDEFGLADGKTVPNEEDWVFLGRYRTAANRGGGFIYTYLLKNAIPILENGGTENFRVSGDDESQAIHFLTFDQIRSHLMDGHFQEVKWTASIALALAHLQNEKN